MNTEEEEEEVEAMEGGRGMGERTNTHKHNETHTSRYKHFITCSLISFRPFRHTLTELHLFSPFPLICLPFHTSPIPPSFFNPFPSLPSFPPSHTSERQSEGRRVAKGTSITVQE